MKRNAGASEPIDETSASTSVDDTSADCCCHTRQLTDRGFTLALANYDHIEHQAALSATKAALLVAANTALGAVYVGLIKDYKIFQQFSWATIDGKLFLAGGLAILLAFLVSVWAIFPKSKPDDGYDVLFYASISLTRSARDYIEAYRAKDPTRLEDELLKNIHGKACWLRRYFGLVRWAIIFACSGVLLTTISVVLMSNYSLMVR